MTNTNKQPPQKIHNNNKARPKEKKMKKKIKIFLWPDNSVARKFRCDKVNPAKWCFQILKYFERSTWIFQTDLVKHFENINLIGFDLKYLLL